MTDKSFTELHSEMQQRLSRDIEWLKRAQSIVHQVGSSTHTESDMIELNGLIASIIGKLEYQHKLNAGLNADE